MESTITGTVGNVTGRETSKGVIHEIVIGDKKLSAWSDSGLGEQANALQGSTVEAVYETKQNGNFTNHYLKSLKLTDAAPTTASGIPLAPATSPESRGGPKADDDTAARIARSVAFEHMPQYVEVWGTDADIFVLLDQFATWIYNGSKPGQEQAAPAETTDSIPW